MDNAYENIILDVFFLTAMFYTDLKTQINNTFQNMYFEVFPSGYSKQV